LTLISDYNVKLGTVGATGLWWMQSTGTLQFGRDTASPKIQQESMVSDVATKTLSILGSNAFATATTNIVGGGLTLVAGSGASSSVAAAHGGSISLAGGAAFGTGVAGAVNLGYTGSAARGSVKVWSPLTMDAGFALMRKTVGTLPTASASTDQFFIVTDASSPVAGSPVTGGGATFCTVRSSGSAWIVNGL
jgi:hypothetical protein